MEPYYEIQRFDKWWMKLAFLLPVAFVLATVITGKTRGEGYTGFVISGVLVIVLGLLFLKAKLETRIDDAGITVRYFPFQRTYYYVKWEEIESAEVLQYRPLMEYGGWGLRYSMRNGRAFSVSGKQGLKLVLKSGSKFMIGTQNADAMREYLQALKSDRQLACIV